VFEMVENIPEISKNRWGAEYDPYCPNVLMHRTLCITGLRCDILRCDPEEIRMQIEDACAYGSVDMYITYIKSKLERAKTDEFFEMYDFEPEVF